MDRSQYLARAMQEIQASPQAAPAGMSPAELQRLSKAAQAWKARRKGYLDPALMPAQAQPVQAAAPAPQQQMQPTSGAMVQPSLQANGNALPEFTLPEWARDGTAADDPGARTFIDMSRAPNPYGQLPAGAGAPGKRSGAAPGDPQGPAGGGIAQFLAKLGSRS